MSAKGRGAVVQPDELYETQPGVTRALLRKLDVRGRTILEPGCGRGAIVRELVAAGAKEVVGIEKNEESAERARRIGGHSTIITADFLTYLRDPSFPEIDIAIGNPPFSLALEFIERARLYTKTIAMLLRVGFIGSERRSAWHKRNPSDMWVLDKRPGFVASIKCATANTDPTCAWRVTLPLDAPRLTACPRCGSVVTTSTTDSTEYAWFVWGLGGGRWEILDTSGL